MPPIADITPSVIKDSLDNLTIEVTLTTDDGVMAVDSVPTGVSRGSTEGSLVPAPQAAELIKTIIAPKLIGIDVADQQKIDNVMIELDGTSNKDKLGANATLAISLAAARAAAKSQKIPLYRYIANLIKTSPKIPHPLMVMIEGGKHGFGNPLTYQEFLVAGKLSEGERILEALQKRFSEEQIRWNKGSEGGLAPFLPTNEAALDLLFSVRGETHLALDIAASHIKSTGFDLIKLIDKYELKLVEDPFPENEWSAWASLTQVVHDSVDVVADDLTTTNIHQLNEAIDKKAANAIIIKPNQIGTLSETLAVVKKALDVHWDLVVSHRAGETLDDFITDLAVGIGAKYLKAGSPTQKERRVKYERLEFIEHELKSYHEA